MMAINLTDNSSQVVDSPQWLHICFGSWLVLVYCLSVFLNGISVIVFLRQRKLITNGTILILAILVNSLLMTVFGYVMPIIGEFSGHFFIHLSMIACQMEAFIVYFFGLSSLLLHCMIALHRYLAINSMSYNVTMTRKHLLVTLLGCQIVSFIIALCPLIGFGSYGLEAHGTSCGLAWEDTSAASQGYLVLITVVCFALPLAIIVVCYSLIFRTVWKTNKGVGPLADSTSVNRKKKQLQLIKLSVALVVVFVICWTPYAIVSFDITFGQPEEINPMMPRFAAWFAKTEAVLNPIVYVLMSKSFRRNIEHLVCCIDTTVAPPRNLTTFGTHGQRIQSEVCDSQVPVTLGISSRE